MTELFDATETLDVRRVDETRDALAAENN